MKSTGIFLLFTTALLPLLNASCSMGGMEAIERDSDVPPSGYVMKFVRKGGYLGTNDVFWIYPDGNVLNSKGKKATIQADLVKEWTGKIWPVSVPVSKKTPFMGLIGMDCYTYEITLYQEGETKALSLTCTDKYAFDREGEISLLDISPIRDILISLSWE